MANKIYNWAIIGPGKIAHTFVADLQMLPNANLYGVGSRNIDRARNFAKQYGFKNAYGSYEELASDPDVEIVYIASPHVDHYKSTLLCLENGKAVLCEKPVAINAGQLNAMTGAAKKNNVFFMEALWTRFIPSFQRCRQMIEEGAIGDVELLEADFCFKAQYDIEGRLFNPFLGGGSLLDIGIYPVFIALSILGTPESIKAIAKLADTGVDSTCSMIMRHSGGAISTLFSSFVTDGRNEALIHGSEGILKLRSRWHSPSSLELIIRDKENEHFAFIEPGNGYQYEASEVMKCIDEKRIESTVFSWQDSHNLINTLDTIRKQAGIVYPKEIEML
jgi:predicted dehydrogenase